MRRFIAALAIALTVAGCVTTPDGKDALQIDAVSLDAIVNDYAEWTLENPTGTFDEYRPVAIANVLDLAGVAPGEDPQAALLAWLDDTPVTAASLLTATVIVQDRPELFDYRIYIAQILTKLGGGLDA